MILAKQSRSVFGAILISAVITGCSGNGNGGSAAASSSTLPNNDRFAGSGSNGQQANDPTTTTTQNPQSNPTTEAKTAPSASKNKGSATLSWSVPTARENGETLQMSDLSGYEVYYTTTSGAEKTFPINNPSETTITINNLAPDTYYFAMAVIDAEGVYSELSNTASKTIN